MDMGPDSHLLPCAVPWRWWPDKKRRLRFVDAFGLRETCVLIIDSKIMTASFDDAIYRVERVGAGCTGIFCRQDELLAGDSPTGIDFIDSEFDAVAGLDAEQRQIAGEGGSQTKRDR